jgi:hypothetical protein
MSQKTSIPHEPGAMTPDEAIEWTKAQIGEFPNYASNPEIAERVLRFCNDLMATQRERMRKLHQRWEAIFRMMAGNTLDRTSRYDVHVPEVYKAIEALVPRIEEAVFDADPPFRVRGRDKGDERRSDVIGAYLDWQLDQCRAWDLIQPGVRDMLICQAAAHKVCWDRKVQQRVRRNVKVDQDDGTPQYKIESEKVEEVVFDGPVIQLIDPFCFFIDPKATTPQNASFVGDISLWNYTDLLRYERMGWFVNVDGLFDKSIKKPVGGNMDSRVPNRSLYEPIWNSQRARDPATPWGKEYSSISEGEAKKFWIMEVWCLFDLYNDGVERECVFTVADGRVVLRAQENFLDSQVRPYATGRVAKNGHNFYGTGIVDNAVRVNVDLDRIRKHATRAAELSVNPLVFTEIDSSLPDTVYEIQPGTIFKGVGKVEMSRMPNTLDAWSVVETVYKNDIEEIMGSPRVFQGTEGAATATEMERKVKEANRRIRAMIRSYSDLWVQTLRIMHNMNQQFTTRKTAFRVMGKRAKRLTEYVELGPDTLMMDVDFEFVGLSNLHSYDMRATALQNALQTTLPILLQHPDKVDLLSAARQLIALTVGPSEADMIIKDYDDPADVLPQEQENLMLLSGQEVDVSELDDHQQHIDVMVDSGLLDKAMDSSVDARVRTAIMNHYMRHEMLLGRQRAQDQARQRQAEQRGSLLPPEAGGSTGPNGQSPLAGGMSAALTQGPAVTPRGETPGPARSAVVGRGGRAPDGIPQTENRV